MSLSIRVKKIADYYENNVNQFALAIGQSDHSNISNLINGKTKKPRFDLIEAILKTYTKVNARWLITGVGDMHYPTEALPNMGSLYDNDDELQMVKDDGQAMCYKCVGKDHEIRVLSKQIDEYKLDVAERDRKIGRLEERLENCDCQNNHKSSATG